MNKVISLAKYEVAKNVNLKVTYRILSLMCDEGPSKITHLAMRSCLNHSTCKKYVNLMLLLEWLEINYDKEEKIFNVTCSGREILNNLKKFN